MICLRCKEVLDPDCETKAAEMCEDCYYDFGNQDLEDQFQLLMEG